MPKSTSYEKSRVETELHFFFEGSREWIFIGVAEARGYNKKTSTHKKCGLENFEDSALILPQLQWNTDICLTLEPANLMQAKIHLIQISVEP